MTFLKRSCVVFVAALIGVPWLFAQPQIFQPDDGNMATTGISNLRAGQPAAEGTEVQLTMEVNYDGHFGPTVKVIPVIKSKKEPQISRWFGADPVTVGRGRSPIVVKVKYFNDEPGVPPEVTSDRVLVLLINSGGTAVVGSSVVLKTIKWGSPNAKSISLPQIKSEELATTTPPVNQAAAQAEAKRLAEESAKAAAVARDAQLKAAAEIKAREEARVKAEAEAKAREQARLAAEAEAKRLAAEQAKAEAAALEAKNKADAEAKSRAEARAQAEKEAKAREEARLAAEAEAKRLAAEQAKAVVAAQEAQRKVEAEAQARAEARAQAEKEAKVREAARVAAEAEAKRLAVEQAKAVAAAEEAQRKVEAEAQARAEARAQAEKEAKAREQARIKAEQEEKARAAAAAIEAKNKAEAEAIAQAKQLAEEKAKAEAAVREAQLKAAAEAKAREEARIKAEAEEKAREEARIQAEAKAKQLAEERAKAEAAAREAKAKADAEALAQEQARQKADAEAKAAEQARIKADAEAKRLVEEKRIASEKAAQAEAAAKRAAEQKPVAVSTTTSSASKTPLVITKRKSKITNVDVVNRSLDRSQMTIGVEYEYSKDDDQPKMGVDLARTGEGVSSYFAAPPVDLGKKSRNFALFPVKFQPPSDQAAKLSSFPTDKVWVYLGEPASKSYIFNATMLLVWHPPGGAGDVAIPSNGSSIQLEDFKQNDPFSGYVTVRYNLVGDAGKVRARVYDSANPKSAEWFESDDVEVKTGPGLQVIKFAVPQDSKTPSDIFSCDTIEIQLLDDKDATLAIIKKQTPMNWAKPK